MEEIDIADIVSALWKRKIIIIAVTIVFAIIACIGCIIVEHNNDKENLEKNQNESQVYYAQTTFLVAVSEVTNTKIEKTTLDGMSVDINENMKNTVDGLIINTYNQIVKSETILNNVKDKLNIDEDLYNSVIVSQVNASNVVAITVRNNDKEQAIKIADELMNAFVQNMSKSYFVDNVTVIDKAHILSDEDLANICKEYIEEAVEKQKSLSNLLIDFKISKLMSLKELQNIFEKYVFTDEKIVELKVNDTLKSVLKIETDNNRNIKKYTVYGAVLGIIASCGMIVAMNVFSKTIKNEGNIPDKILATVEYKGSKNIFDILRITLEKNRMILITSPEVSDKDIYIANNLGIAFAKIQKKTLILDVTTNNASVDEFKVKGLSDFMKDKSQKLDDYILKSDIDNLNLLSLGTEENINLHEKELKDVMEILEKNYDYVIINSNNIIENANALELSKMIKNTILVARQDKTRVDSYAKSKKIISEVSGNLLGTIFLK